MQRHVKPAGSRTWKKPLCLSFLWLVYLLGVSKSILQRHKKVPTVEQVFKSSPSEWLPTSLGGCRWYREYVRFHKKTVQKLQRGSTEVKLLVYECHDSTGLCGGLGDRLSGMASLFYAAVVLKRAFVIDQRKPLSLDQVFTPKSDINWNVADLIPSSLGSTTMNMIDKYTIQDIEHIFLPIHKKSNVLRVSMNRYYTGRALWQELSDGYPWFFGAMRRVNSLECPLLAHDGETFALAFDSLFHPSLQVAKRIERVEKTLGLREFRGPLRDFIAIHGRVGGVVNSAVGVAGWEDPARPTFATVTDAKDLVHCAQAKRSAVSDELHIGTTSSLPIVVFSDSPGFKEESAKIDSQLRFLNDSMIFHIDRSAGDSDTVLRGYIDAVAEFSVLSSASCIVSSSSTFSGSAASLLQFRKRRACFFYFRNCDRLIPDFWSLTEPPFVRVDAQEQHIQ